MNYLQYRILIIPLAIIIGFVLDLVIGDPQRFPHPVRIIGRFSKIIEELLINLKIRKKISGTIFASIIIISTWLFIVVILLLSGLLYLINFYAFFLSVLILLSFFVYTSLAVKDLKVECMKVYHDLKNNDIASARQSLSMIVGRDTERLDRSSIIKATVETISENCVDGILSPLFYAFLGGPALALAFKASSTLDSMYGYKNKKYIQFGCASAKIDDWANFIPARLSIILLPLASLFYGRGFMPAFNTIKKYRRNSPSPNSGIPEAAIAGALDLQLGGEISYRGISQVKPVIGEKRKDFELKDIIDAIKIVYIFSFTGFFVGLLLYAAAIALFLYFADLGINIFFKI